MENEEEKLREQIDFKKQKLIDVLNSQIHDIREDKRYNMTLGTSLILGVTSTMVALVSMITDLTAKSIFLGGDLIFIIVVFVFMSKATRDGNKIEKELIGQISHLLES